ncbi:MAG: hypothetical protein H7X71_03555 [Chitinophagales bacterium]|nr:hypothetical protein [Chitinophagales bacterium]
MYSIRPVTILLSLLTVLILLGLISILFPSSGVVSIGGMKIHFLTLEKIKQSTPHGNEQKESEVNDLLSFIDTSAFTNIETDIQTIENDSLAIVNNVDQRIRAQVIQHLEFAESDTTRLQSLFEKLTSGKPVRILHYGDSQIEGDRMTGFLRQKLQSQFGGSGVGLIMPFNLYNTNAYVLNVSPEWKRYTGFSAIDPAVKHKRYGVMASFSRFTEIETDSVDPLPVTAWIEVGASKNAYGNAQRFSSATLMYGNCKDSVSLKIMAGDKEIYSSLLNSDGAYHTITVKASSVMLKYIFEGNQSPDIYAFSLEGDGGVMIDNIALRGSSGTFFNGLDQNLQSSMFNDLGVELFILQFGGNTIPYISDTNAVNEYCRGFERQMTRLKKLRPQADIIVIGPSDMSTKIEGSFKSYPLLTDVITGMKQAAFNAGAAYWDMYTAMGGENSMPVWVAKDLAGDDHTHFSPAGSKYIIQMFYDALMVEYQHYSSQ